MIIQGCFYGVSAQGLSRLTWCNHCIIVYLENYRAVPKRLHRERKKYIPEWGSSEHIEPRNRQYNFSVFLLFRQIARAFWCQLCRVRAQHTLTWHGFMGFSWCFILFFKSQINCSQSNSVPTYASDFSLSSPPKTNRAFLNSSKQCVGALYPLLQHQLLRLSCLTVPPPPPSAPTGSI